MPQLTTARRGDRRTSPVILLVMPVAAWLCIAATVEAQVPQAVLDRDAHLAQLAAEAAQRGPAMPIPLLGEGTRPLGAVYDQFLVGVVVGRAEIAAGRPADTTAITAHPTWRSRGTVVVAYPVDCDGRPNRPLAIRWRVAAGLPVPPTPIGDPLRGTDAQAVLPGVALQPDALVVNFRNAPMIGAAAEVDYAGPVCHGAATTASLPVTETPSRGLSTAFLGVKLPAELASLPSPTTVRLRVTLDPTGRARFPEQVQGPAELESVAVAALNARTYPPATVNGVPMPLNILVPFVFTSTGAPSTPEPYVPAPPPPGANGQLVVGRSVMTAVPAGPTTPPPVVPPAPPGQTDTELARLAIEIAQKGDPVPIPLDPAGPARHGVLFDRFLVGAVKARAAIAGGASMDPVAASPTLVQDDLIAVAFPLDCGGRTIAPSDLHISVGGTRPGPLPERGTTLTGESLQARLPGVRFPDGSIGRAFVNASLSLNLEVRVSYAQPPCGGDASPVTLPIQWVRASAVRRLAIAKIPDGVSVPSPTTVQMRGLVDLNGAYRFPTVADGPTELEVTAMVTAAGWQFQPYRANGVPTPTSVVAPLTFTASGMPEPPGAVGPPATSGGAPPVATSATIGGRSTEDFTTPDEVGLTSATSQCAIAPDANYGLTPAGAIKTGGGAMQGPAREKRYLSFLRGPNGQGLHIVRRGSLPAPDGQTILDLYEITYTGLAAPLRIYLDEYHDGTLQAPQGLVCAQPIVIR